MKNLLRIGLLALLMPLCATAQIQWPDNLATKEYVQKTNARIDSIVKVLKGGVITDPVGPTPGKDDCDKGPFLGDITSVTSTGLTFQFDAEGVHGIEYWVRDEKGNQVSHGLLPDLTGNTQSIKYTAQKPGTYHLSIAGSTCNSKVYTKVFYISGIGVVDPIPGTTQTIARGLPGHLNIEWSVKNGKNLVSDVSTVSIGEDYEYRYLIGSEVVFTGKSLLKDYVVEGINPGRILKYKIKPQYATLNHWTDRPSEENGYYSMSAAEGFSHNVSIAFETFARPGAVGSFLNPIPDNYNPATQQVQWADLGKPFKLPKGHIYIENPRPWGINKALDLGVSQFSNYALPWADGPPYSEVVRLMDAGLTYNDVPRIETVLGVAKQGNSGQQWSDGVSKDWWPEWDNGKPGYEEGYQMGLRADISHAIFIGEFSENISWLPANAEVFRGFYDAYMPRMEERFGKRGIPYQVCHDYLLLGGERLSNGRDQAKRILTLSKDQMPVSNFSPGRSLAKTNLIVETVYLAAPDIVTAQPYELIFRMEYFKQMGFDAGVFLAGVHEWRPNNLYEITYPDGNAYAYSKIPLDPNLHIADGFLAQVFGKLFIEWGGAQKTESKAFAYDYIAGLPFWQPKGSKDFQGYSQYLSKIPDGEKYYAYSGSPDLSFFSQKLFADTYGIVEGGVDQYLSYRLDGGEWITPTGKDYIDAYYDKRGFVHSRTLNGRTAFFFLNCFTDNKTRKIEIRMPSGQIWNGTVAGNGIHAQLI